MIMVGPLGVSNLKANLAHPNPNPTPNDTFVGGKSDYSCDCNGEKTLDDHLCALNRRNRHYIVSYFVA